jgi:hypothetical protein
MPHRKRGNEPGSGSRPDPKSRPHHIADEPVDAVEPEDPGVQSPVTDTGLPVEEQIRKEWDPNKDGGLPTLLTESATTPGGR